MSRLLCLVVTLAVMACTASKKPLSPADLPTGPVQPVPISEDAYAAAVHRLLTDGRPSTERLALLAGVVRRQFARAKTRFATGHPERGLASVAGALLLIRAGEMRPEMFDANAAKALQNAYVTVAPLGREGPALAFLHLWSAAVGRNHPDQKRIRKHVSALRAWMKDTRQDSVVENTIDDALAFGEQSVLEPTPESLKAARSRTVQWITASVEFNESIRRARRRPERDQMVGAYRGLRTGAVILAGLYLRHGDAAGAVSALERTEARRITSPDLFERLETAAQGDAAAWQDLAVLYARANEQEAAEAAFPKEIARGAAFGSVVEAYRHEPTATETTVILAQILPQLGMPDASPVVLLDALRESQDPELMARSLRFIVAVMVQEAEAGDTASVRQVFRASHGLLTLADTMHQGAPLDPSPAAVRFAMATLEVRSGNLDAARRLLASVVRTDPSLQGYLTIAAILEQSGDRRGALDAIGKGLVAPDAASAPLGQAETHLLAFRIHRKAGAVASAKRSLAAALAATMKARKLAADDASRASAERMLARLAYYFGDREAWSRAMARTFAYAEAHHRVLSMALIEATSTALLYGAVDTSRDAMQRTIDSKVDDEDLVYAALWLHLTQRAAGKEDDGTVRDALSSIARSSSWISHLARWGLGEFNDRALRSRAQNLVQRTEADFYIAMRKRIAGDASAQQVLSRIGRGPAIDLVETHLARELTLPSSARTWGPPPTPLP